MDAFNASWQHIARIREVYLLAAQLPPPVRR